MVQEYDLVIIGGGPGGLSCANEASKLGLKVLILEDHKQIGVPIHCGECFSELSSRRDKLRLPSSVISKKVRGVRITFPNGKRVILEEPGFVLKKDKFEQWMAKTAKGNGAMIRTASKVSNIEKVDGGYEITSLGSKFFAKIVIDASGANSFSSGKLGINKSSKTVLGVQYLVENIEWDNYLDFYILPKYAPFGYCWVIPKEDGMANIGLVSKVTGAKAMQNLDRFLDYLTIPKKKVVKTFGGLIPTTGPVAKIVDDSLMFVGDAAGFTSPMFEGGTQLAITSGRFAALVARKAIEKDDVSTKKLLSYRKMCKNEFPNYDKLVKGKNAFYKLKVKEMEDLAELLPEQFTSRFANSSTVMLNLVGKKRHMIKKDVFLALMTLKYSKAKHYGW
ncbi:geranylgeranyl reductase family protein [archaeon]|nr:geranylgeranyl reductase family protein [archaeon]